MFLFPLSSHGSLVTGNLEVSFIDIYMSWSFKGETAAEMYPKGDVLNKSVQNVPVCVIAQWEKWWGQGREVKERECPIRAHGMFCNGDKWCSHWLEMGEASFLFLKFVFNWRTIALQHCVVSAIGQHESAVSVHTSPSSWSSLPLPSPPIPPLWDVTEHRLELSATPQLPIGYFTCGNIYVSGLLFRFLPPSPSRTVYSLLCLHLREAS